MSVNIKNMNSIYLFLKKLFMRQNIYPVYKWEIILERIFQKELILTKQMRQKSVKYVITSIF